jgi:hypothetical protein
MTALALIIKWFTDRDWNHADIVSLCKEVSPPGISWPKTSSRHNEQFFSEMLRILENEVPRSVTIAIFERLSKAFPDESATLERITQGLRMQIGPGANIQALISDFTFKKLEIHTPPAIVAEKAPREDLFPRFLEFARARDIVFALGGVGSGLDTFTRQFADHMNRNPITVITADFSAHSLSPILHARAAAEEARSGCAAVHLELKCLLTSLAHATYSSLRSQFPEEIDRGLGGRHFPDALAFSDYFYAENPKAMYQGERSSILRHFFETTQRFAEMVVSQEVLVFMPWKKLAACFHEKAEAKHKILGDELWKALSEKAATPRRRARIPHAHPSPTTPPLDMYDRVCLVVCCNEVPFAHSAFLKKELVSKCVWPIPPLSLEIISDFVDRVISTEEADSIAREIAAWTGGAPWYVRLLLSYVAANHHLIDIYLYDYRALVAACARKAMDALDACGNGVPEPVGDFIRRHLKKVRDGFGDGHNDDAAIEERWAGPQDEVEDGYHIEPYRLEAFVASGLVWLKGDPWEPDREDYVFSKYPVVRFERANELALAVYRSVTGKMDVRLTAY